ncbi:MAG: FecR family protein [Cyclobacteriaceae bacterium]|nr:FecR family protein [Cyclobacteriaceae bacterium]
MKNLDKDILDLLGNEFFIRWIKNPDDVSRAYWEKWMASYPEKSDIVHRAKSIIESFELRDQPALSPSRYEEMLNTILDAKKEKGHKNLEPYGNRKIDNVTRSWYAAAVISAVITFFALSVILTPEVAEVGSLVISLDTISVPQGAKRTIKLPDGSIVKLNSGSTIIYPKTFDSKSRRVEFSGEGLFYIARDESRPFILKSQSLNVNVLGTIFNVKDYGKDPRSSVALLEGALEVSSSLQKNPVSLEPGNAAIYEKKSGTLDTDVFDQKAVTAWTEGILLLKAVDLYETIRILEDWYGVRIKVEVPPKENVKISGYFDNELLSNVLQSLSYTVNFDYVLEDKKVSLTFRK